MKMILVDPEDQHHLENKKWAIDNKGYVRHSYRVGRREGKSRHIKLHRLIMGVTDPKVQVDHINGNRLDNRKSNLRLVTPSQNQWNRKPNANSSSQYKGVSKRKSGKWLVQLRFNKTYHRIGLFEDEVEAAKAYNAKAKELFGEYARLNDVETNYVKKQKKDVEDVQG